MEEIYLENDKLRTVNFYKQGYFHKSIPAYEWDNNTRLSKKNIVRDNGDTLTIYIKDILEKGEIVKSEKYNIKGKVIE